LALFQCFDTNIEFISQFSFTGHIRFFDLELAKFSKAQETLSAVQLHTMMMKRRKLEENAFDYFSLKPKQTSI